MEEPAESPDVMKHDTVKRPMNAFLIFCKRHRGLVHQKNPSLDNRSVTRILGDLWANLGPDEKYVYTDLAKQYKEAFLKANPDYKWYNPEKHTAQLVAASGKPSRPTISSLSTSQSVTHTSEGISPGKLADPSNMGGLSMLLMAGQQNLSSSSPPSNGDQLQTVSSSVSVAQSIPGLTKEESDFFIKTSSAAMTTIPSDKDVHRWPLEKPPDVDTEVKSLSRSAARKVGKSESEATWKTHFTESPMDLSRSADVGQGGVCVELSPAVKGGILGRQDLILPGSCATQARLANENSTEEVAWRAVQNSLTGRDSFILDKPSRLGKGPGLLPTTDGQVSFVSSLPASNFPLASSDFAKAPLAGNPFAYILNLPIHKVSELSPQNVPADVQLTGSAAGHLNSKPSMTKAAMNDLKLDNSESILGSSSIPQMVMEKVIEAVYAKEQESGIPAFPKTKKQLAVDKFSMSGKPGISNSKNGTPDAEFLQSEMSLSRFVVPFFGNDVSLETCSQVVGEKGPSAEENSLGLGHSEQNTEGMGMTIGEINEKLIMKVVQEDNFQQLNGPQVNESRLPLKLQKKFKKFDDAGQLSSSSAVFSSSQAAASMARMDTPNDAARSSDSWLLSSSNVFSSLVEKSMFSTARNQNATVFSNLTAAGQPPCSATNTNSAGNVLLPTSAAFTRTITLAGTPQLAVNKLIETLINESFAGTSSSTDDLKPGPGVSAQNFSASPVRGGDRPLQEFENGVLSSQPLKHVNKTTDDVKTPKRKRCRKPDSLEYFQSSNNMLPATDRVSYSDSIINAVKNCPSDGHLPPVEGTIPPAGGLLPPADGLLPPKRLKESTVSASSETNVHEVSDSTLDLCKILADPDPTRMSGTWQLIGNVLNERPLDTNGQRTQEEINNNSREKMARNMDHDGVPQMSKALRKSKRSNQGLRYKELMSKGVLYTSRKSTDSNMLNEDIRDDAYAVNEDDVNDIGMCAAEISFPRRRFRTDSTSAEAEGDVTGRRYKSGDFDLEAHIACLPACQIEVTDRKSAGRTKSRTHSQSQPYSSNSLSLARIQRLRSDLRPEDLKNGASLEMISFSRLRSLCRLAASACNGQCLVGSTKRKARTHGIFQILPLSLYNGRNVQTSCLSITSPDDCLLSPTAYSSVAVYGVDDVLSPDRMTSDDGHVLCDKSHAAQTSFDILADAAAVSSGD